MLFLQSSEGVNTTIVAILLTASLLVSGFIIFLYAQKAIPIGYHVLTFISLSSNFVLIVIQPIDIYHVSKLPGINH